MQFCGNTADNDVDLCVIRVDNRVIPKEHDMILTEQQLAIKSTIVAEFLRTFETLEVILKQQAVSEQDESAIRESIEQDFEAELN